jgi:hypothetical protein
MPPRSPAAGNSRTRVTPDAHGHERQSRAHARPSADDDSSAHDAPEPGISFESRALAVEPAGVEPVATSQAPCDLQSYWPTTYVCHPAASVTRTVTPSPAGPSPPRRRAIPVGYGRSCRGLLDHATSRSGARSSRRMPAPEVDALPHYGIVTQVCSAGVMGWRTRTNHSPGGTSRISIV